MKTKKIAILGSILLIMVALAVGDVCAEEWPINGEVVRAGMQDDQVKITIKDVNGNFWTAPAASGQENEQLATALTALASGIGVTGTWETTNSTWVDMVASTE